MDKQKHWENIYETKEPTDVSWFQTHLEKSLMLIIKQIFFWKCLLEMKHIEIKEIIKFAVDCCCVTYSIFVRELIFAQCRFQIKRYRKLVK